MDLRQHINIFYVNVYWKDSPLTKDNLSRPVSQAHKWDVSLKLENESIDFREGFSRQIESYRPKGDGSPYEQNISVG